ncbi:hypothetical protein KQH27_00110 [bacterium]|nr:hypothetical protein [bacterium]
MPYSIEEHRHRFAAWAASRASTVNGCRFRVSKGQKIIELSGLMKIGENIDYLPNPDEFDDYHREWRYCIIEQAHKYQLPFTHGIAAKLINIYLKSIYVCGGQHDDQRVKAIHPPIDSVLLDSLCENNTGELFNDWQVAQKIRWSKLESKQYEDLIGCIKKVIPVGVGLWFIEEHWQGYQKQNNQSILLTRPINGKVKKRMPNADKLWTVVQSLWPINDEWLTIDEIMGLAPIKTAGINNRSSYDFAMLTMVSTVRRDFIVHENTITESAINDELIKTNRNNGIWRKFLNSRVRKKH